MIHEADRPAAFLRGDTLSHGRAMELTLTMTAGGVPAGAYVGEFVGVEPFEGGQEDYGEAVLLRWRITGGEHDGAEATRIVSKKFSPKSGLAKFAVALAGRAIAPGEAFSFASVVGVRGSLVVAETPSGSGTRVEAFIRTPAN